MNPKTKLTVDYLKNICARHNIIYKSHQRITIGFSHEVHRLNEDLVIKLFNKTSNKNYLSEKAILSVKNSNILKPELVAAYNGRVGERSYLIMSYLPGVSLGSVWHMASNAQREKLISEIVKTLVAFQDIESSVLSFLDTPRWEEYIVRKTEKMVAKLRQKHAITSERADEVEAAISKALGYFQDNEELSLVYWDIHFDNFIVNEKFELKGVIDLENVRLLPLDYPLFVVKKQMEQPHKYLSEENEKYANKNDYIHLWEWYRKYYPKMFAYNHLEERILTYQLLDELHLMIDWSFDVELRNSFIDRLSQFRYL